MSSPATHLEAVSTRFNSLGLWADCMNSCAPNCWFVGGAFAAFLHIDNYADKDAADYAATRMQIFPSSIDVGIESARCAAIQARYGEMLVYVAGSWLPVRFFRMEMAAFESQKCRCELDAFPPRPTPFLIYTAASLLSAYCTAGSALPRNRQMMVAMLKLMVRHGHIDRRAIEEVEPVREPALIS